MLQTVFELLIRSHNHIKGLLVLLLPVNEVLQSSSRALYVPPSAPFTLLANKLISFSIVQVHFLLLLEREVKLRVEAACRV